MNQPSSAVLAAAQSKKKPSDDKLAFLKAQAKQARDLTLEINSIDETLKEKKEELHDLQFSKLPDLMEEIGLDVIGVPAEGNKQGMDFKITPYYSASISAKWPPEKQLAAFDLLKRLKAESLIKTEVSAKLPKGSLKLAKQLIAAAKKLKITADLKQMVAAQTLTAWMREIYDKGQSLSATDLEAIGGSVGRYVKPVERE
jgi:hypothetical protein